MLSLTAGGAGSWLYPAKLSAALPKYRELLRTTHNSRSNGGSTEESSSLFQQAKERVLLRLRGRRRAPVRVDPRRAFSRMHDRWAAARLRLQDLKNEQKERLRQYVAIAVGGSDKAAASSMSSSTPALAAAKLAAPYGAAHSSAAEGAGGGMLLDAASAAQTVMGIDGPLRHLVLAGVGGACKLFLSVGTRTSVAGQEHMAAALARAPSQGLITISNHVGSIDDPLITSSLVPASKLLDPGSVRWTLCATDRCFKSAALVPFFRAGKVLPVERGAGLAQFGMQLAQSRLRKGEWVHIFPEGTRSRDGRMLPVRKGVGWLVVAATADGGQPPLVLPFVHSGMESILPKGSTLPKLGQELRVLVGEPVPLEDLLCAAAEQGWGEERLQAAITNRVGQTLYRLKAQLDGLPLEAVVPKPAASAIPISEDTLLPLIEDEMDSLVHCWHNRWQCLLLPTLTQRVRSEAAERRAALRTGGVFGACGSFEGIAAATEEAAGMVSSWEHAGTAPAPWAAAFAATEPSSEPASCETAEPATSSSARAAAAAAANRAEQLRLLARQKLRQLRGGMQAAVASVPWVAETSGSSSSSSQPGYAAAAPLDAVMARLAAAGGTAGQLQGLLAAAADYSALRVQHMHQLLLPAASLAAPSPAAAAGT